MTKTVKIILLYWIPTILWMGVIFYLSNQPDLKTNLGIWDLILRKLAHLFEFGILTLLIWRALRQSLASSIKPIIFSGIIALLYAISDEIHQLFISKRVGSPVDVGIDCAGILIVIILILLSRRYREIKKIKTKLAS